MSHVVVSFDTKKFCLVLLTIYKDILNCIHVRRIYMKIFLFNFWDKSFIKFSTRRILESSQRLIFSINIIKTCFCVRKLRSLTHLNIHQETLSIAAILKKTGKYSWFHVGYSFIKYIVFRDIFIFSNTFLASNSN